MPVVQLILEYGLRYGPDMMIAVRKILAKKELPTEADWEEIDAILRKTGESYFERKNP